MSRSPRERVTLFALAIVVALVAIQVRVVAGRTWDDVRYHTEIAPPRIAAATQIHAATLPQWWDGAGLGVPLLAEPSHGAAYPPLWLAASPRSLDLVLVVHMVWLAIGLALWARRSASDLAAGGAAILVATSGLVAASLFAGALPALAHVPWVGFTASGLARVEKRSCRARYALALAGCLALIALAGQLAVFVDALALACVLAARRATWRWLAIAIGSALAIGCVQWLPALAVHGIGSDVHGLPLARLVELVVPAHSGNGWSATLFVGAPLLAFALVAAFTPRSAPAGSRDGACAGRVRGVVVLAIMLAVLVLVVGRGGWPGVLGAPELHLGVLAILAGVAAARGIDQLDVLGAHAWPKRTSDRDKRGNISTTIDRADAKPRRAERTTGGVRDERRASDDIATPTGAPSEAGTILRVLIGAAAASAVVAIAAAFARGEHPGFGRAVVDGTMGAGCVALAAVMARVKPLAVVLVVVPSVAALHATAPTTAASAVARPTWVDAAFAHTDPTPIDRAANRMPVPSIDEHTPLRLYRPDRLDGLADDELDEAMDTLAGTSAARFGIARANTSDPARLAVEDRLWTAASHGGGALLDRFGVTLAVLPAVVAGGGFAELGRRGTWSLVRYPALPIAATYGNWMFLTDERATFAQLFPAQGMQGAGRGRVVLAGAGTPSEEAEMTPSPCTIVDWRPGAIDLNCTATEEAYAVVSSAARDGWTATIDGRDAPWLVADVVRRAVAVSAGAHAVSWRYRAPLLVPALVIAALGLAILVMLAVLGWREKR